MICNNNNYLYVIGIIIILLFIFRHHVYKTLTNTKSRTIVIILSTTIIMAAGILSLSGDYDLCLVIGGNTIKQNLNIPDFNAIILPKLKSKLTGCGGGDDLVGKSCQWTVSPYPNPNTPPPSVYTVPETCPDIQLDACNYERQTWSGNDEGFNPKYENKLWATYRSTLGLVTAFTPFIHKDGGKEYIHKTTKHNFYPTTQITNNTTGDFDDTSFNFANGFDNDVYTNEKIKLETQISLVTDKKWGVKNYHSEHHHQYTIPSRYSYYEYGKTLKGDGLLGEAKKLTDHIPVYSVAVRDIKPTNLLPHFEGPPREYEIGSHAAKKLEAEEEKLRLQKAKLDRYTKGQVYIFYKPNIDYVEIVKKVPQTLTGNFWYFVTITGKENAVTANSGFKATVPYGHTDRTIIDDTIGFGASFGVKDTAGNINYSNYSHYLRGGHPKVGFPLNEIMKTHDSAAYAIRVTNKYDSSGMGYEIIGSIFEDTKKPTRANYTPKYLEDLPIKLEWS